MKIPTLALAAAAVAFLGVSEARAQSICDGGESVVYFDRESSRLTPDGYQLVSELAYRISEDCPTQRLEVVGHADSAEIARYPQLGDHRTIMVRVILERPYGLHVTTRDAGATEPTGRAAFDRRVVIRAQ